jgi:hypothetical protein
MKAVIKKLKEQFKAELTNSVELTRQIMHLQHNREELNRRLLKKNSQISNFNIKEDACFLETV